MSNEPKWVFPDNNNARLVGFNTSDMETFKKDPMAHFAREICQNSIDAHQENNPEPARIEFKTFVIGKPQIPGYPDLRREMNLCRNEISTQEKPNKDDEKIANELVQNIGTESGSFIHCLRVSDFNTTGLYGSKSFDMRKPFYALTRGSGSSEKGSGSAGSKGIGKFAAFVVSKTNTVFYSTHAKNPDANEDEDASFGVSKLCSRRLNEKLLYTMGEGFYGIGNDILPIPDQLNLDPNFRREGRYGTDLFIIGFGEKRIWIDKVIKKVLDSFMVAIVRGALEVTVENEVINKLTLVHYIDEIREQPKLNDAEKNIVAQYDILAYEKDDSIIKKKEVKILDDTVYFYAKLYQNGEDEKYATRRCSRVRYPYMKIDDAILNTLARVSALCIIENDDLNATLRRVENPQHTAWEKIRAEDDKKECERVSEALRCLKEEMNKFIAEIVDKGGNDQTILVGAEEYLEDDPEGEPGNTDPGVDTGTQPVEDQTFISTPTRKPHHIRTDNGVETEDEDGEPSTTLATGQEDPDGDSLGTPITQPDGGPKPGSGPEPKPTPKPKRSEEDVKIYGEGFEPYKKHILSKNIRFKCMKPANTDTYEITFSANVNENDCEINLFSVGDNSNDTEKVKIESASLNGNPVETKYGRIVHLPIENGKEYKISCKIDHDGLFASKVDMYAYQE